MYGISINKINTFVATGLGFAGNYIFYIDSLTKILSYLCDVVYLGATGHGSENIASEDDLSTNHALVLGSQLVLFLAEGCQHERVIREQAPVHQHDEVAWAGRPHLRRDTETKRHRGTARGGEGEKVKNARAVCACVEGGGGGAKCTVSCNAFDC